MSTYYRNGEDVPTAAICTRLKELSNAVTKGREAVAREFTMRIPAEIDHDADFVLSVAALRLDHSEKRIQELEVDLAVWREGGVTEELLRRHNGCLKVGRGCVIRLASEIPVDDQADKARLCQTRGALHRLCRAVSRRMMPDEPTPEDRLELKQANDAATALLDKMLAIK